MVGGHRLFFGSAYFDFFVGSIIVFTLVSFVFFHIGFRLFVYSGRVLHGIVFSGSIFGFSLLDDGFKVAGKEGTRGLLEGLEGRSLDDWRLRSHNKAGRRWLRQGLGLSLLKSWLLLKGDELRIEEFHSFSNCLQIASLNQLFGVCSSDGDHNFSGFFLELECLVCNLCKADCFKEVFKCLTVDVADLLEEGSACYDIPPL